MPMLYTIIIFKSMIHGCYPFKFEYRSSVNRSKPQARRSSYPYVSASRLRSAISSARLSIISVPSSSGSAGCMRARVSGVSMSYQVVYVMMISLVATPVPTKNRLYSAEYLYPAVYSYVTGRLHLGLTARNYSCLVARLVLRNVTVSKCRCYVTSQYASVGACRS